MNYKLTVADCLERISMRKPDVILRAIQKGELRAINVGSGSIRATWRIGEEDFSAWLESRVARPMPTE